MKKPIQKQLVKVVHVSGKRKHAIARATAYEGSGIIRINHIPLDFYQPEMSRLKIQEPLIIAGDRAQKVNIDVQVQGGGFQGQTEAVRLTVARALVEFLKDKQLKNEFLTYDRFLITQDSRRGECHHPNDSKPRAKRQKSYR